MEEGNVWKFDKDIWNYVGGEMDVYGWVVRHHSVEIFQVGVAHAIPIPWQ